MDAAFRSTASRRCGAPTTSCTTATSCEYLNIIEKFHCTYCEYANGLIAYLREIIGRTEQYFCPIKHARKILGTHARYNRFLDYGDAQDYEARLEAFRKALGKVD